MRLEERLELLLRLLCRRAVAHAEHHHDDHAHEHEHSHEHAHHGEDVHGFFYTDEEMAARAAAEPHEHHHDLDKNHTPKEVPISMWLPLAVLAVLSLGAGWWLEQEERFQKWLYPIQLSTEQRPMYEQPRHYMLFGMSLMTLQVIAEIQKMGGGRWDTSSLLARLER